MKHLAVIYNPTMYTWSMLYCSPHYPIANSLSTVTVNAYSLPELVAEKVAMLRLVAIGDTVPDIGKRVDEHKFAVHLPDDYGIKGLEL
jgi:hypothetical protein